MATTVYIGTVAVQLPDRFAAGDEINETAASVLFSIWVNRIQARLRLMKERGEIDQQCIQERADELAKLDMAPYSSADEEVDSNDVVMQEALAMARNLIQSAMAQDGLPPPKNLDEHAKQLVNGMPALLEKARVRVELRYQAAKEALGLGN